MPSSSGPATAAAIRGRILRQRASPVCFSAPRSCSVAQLEPGREQAAARRKIALPCSHRCAWRPIPAPTVLGQKSAWMQGLCTGGILDCARCGDLSPPSLPLPARLFPPFRADEPTLPTEFLTAWSAVQAVARAQSCQRPRALDRRRSTRAPERRRGAAAVFRAVWRHHPEHGGLAGGPASHLSH